MLNDTEVQSIITDIEREQEEARKAKEAAAQLSGAMEQES